MIRAAIYARYSSDKQTEQSIEGQLRVCQDYAKAHDILILDTYIDRAMTGTNDNRADFQRMIKDSARKEWNYVLVYKLDRFSRDKYATAIHKKTLKDNGVKVLSAMENIPDTPEGIILESLLEGMNQYYSAELSQKVKRGMKETRLKGLYQGGTLPYGYKLDGRKVVIDEQQAKHVLFMYEQYSKGVFVKDIIKALSENGVLHKGKPFAKNTVYGILSNEKYSGSYKKGDEIVDNIYPQIVPTELFTIVRQKVTANKFGKSCVKTVFLLKNKVKCGYCGENINAESGTAKNGTKKYYYKCNGRKSRKNNCKKTAIRKDILEEFVLNSIIELLNDQKQIEYVVQTVMKKQEELIKTNSNLVILEKEQKQNETAINNIMTAIEHGIFTNTTSKRLKELESRQEELERLITIERSKTAMRVTEKQVRDFYKQLLKTEPLLIINYYVKEIVLFDDEIKIIYNSPLNTNSPDESQGFSFYDKIVSIPVIVNYAQYPIIGKIRLIMSV